MKEEVELILNRACDLENEVERLKKENAELREFVKLIVDHYPVACEGEKYHCNWKYELPIERMKAALEGGNHAND